MFDRPWKDRFTVEIPDQTQRQTYFDQIKQRCLESEKIFATEAESILRPINYAVTDQTEETMTKDQTTQLEQKEEATMRTLRIFLRSGY